MGNPKLSVAGNVPIPSVSSLCIFLRRTADALYGHKLDCLVAVLSGYLRLNRLSRQRGDAEKGSSSWVLKFFACILGSLRIALCLVPILSTAACSPTKFDFPAFSLTDTQNSEESDG